MNASSRSIEPDLSGAGLSLAVHSPDLTDFRDVHSTVHLPRSSDTNDGFLRPSVQQQTPLAEWYTSKTAPWDPIHGRSPDVARFGGRFGHRPSGASFSEYRTNYAPPSEDVTTVPGHLSSDSGYGSLTRQSVVDGSLYGDCDRPGDTASVSSHLSGIHFDRPLISSEEDWRKQPAMPHKVYVPIDANKLVCPHCKQYVKTKSELKYVCSSSKVSDLTNVVSRKHRQRHTKPYHCRARDCSRSEGFGTPNDVDRHMRSCHPELSSNGKCYRCTVANCRNKDKKWPRADNFRQHLKRVHNIQPEDDDLEKYVYRPQQPPGPDLAGLGTSVGDGLVSLNVSHDSDPWAYSIQPVQEQTPREVCELNDYMNPQMDFQRDAVVAQQHLAMMPRAEHHVSNHMIQMPHLELFKTTSSLTHREQAHQSEAEGLRDISASSVGAQETNYEESEFFNEASISDSEYEKDEQSVIHEVSVPGTDSTPIRDLFEEPTTLEQPSGPGFAKPSADAAYPEAPEDTITADGDVPSLSTTSSCPDSSASGDNESMQPPPAAIASSEPQTSEGQLDVSDVIKNQDLTFDLIKALKEQGQLAGLLEKLDYQPKIQKETSKANRPAQQAVRPSTHVCPNPECGKSFSRLCELR